MVHAATKSTCLHGHGPAFAETRPHHTARHPADSSTLRRRARVAMATALVFRPTPRATCRVRPNPRREAGTARGRTVRRPAAPRRTLCHERCRVASEVGARRGDRTTHRGLASRRHRRRSRGRLVERVAAAHSQRRSIHTRRTGPLRAPTRLRRRTAPALRAARERSKTASRVTSG